ncbi:hypothetical protein AB0891_25715 [Streptomyces sp. NPDC007259]|uniref:hypothetical protein n=1 Tax=Streptomyces sp. NPDC007259 TaxID=3154319 RepID=UPI003455ED17
MIRCARCEELMRPEESTVYVIPGATGPGISLRIHRERCESPESTRPRTYPT